MMLALALGPTVARAQDSTGIGLDRLRIASLNVQVGRIAPTDVRGAALVAIGADYGELAPHWRIMFGASYWESSFTDHAVRAFTDALRASLTDTTARVQPSPVSVYDVTFSLGARWTPRVTWGVQPYIGAGLAAHVMNAEGKLINGTFVERALDNISAGLWMAAGVELRPHPRFTFDGQARADVISAFRSAEIRVGAAYYFPPPRRVSP